MRLTEHFTLNEFRSPGDKVYPNEEVITNLIKLANELEVIRALWGMPITINSGYRSPEYNKKIGGAVNSQHVLGKAADIVIQGQTPKETQDMLKQWEGGLGCYNTFTHIDIRDGVARWNG